MSLWACVVPGIAQLPVAFEVPLVGYVLDEKAKGIRPVVGIPGNARIGEPVPLGFAVADAAFFRDGRHVIVLPVGSSNLLVVDLQRNTTRIAASAGSTRLRTEPAGSYAAIDDPATKRILVVAGLPGEPVVTDTVDVAFAEGALNRVAVSADGKFVVFSLQAESQEVIYGWSREEGTRFLATAGRVADLQLSADSLVVADSLTAQVLWIRNVRETGGVAVVAGPRDGLSKPAALSASLNNEVYLVDSLEGVFVFSADGRLLRRLRCGCQPETSLPLGDSGLLLTRGLDSPLHVLDISSRPERLYFVPALESQKPSPH
jgi:hypothetical protein